jgi:hypothetical protein
MAAIVYRRVRAAQPQDNAQVDWSNPLSQGLLAVIVGSYTIDPVTGKPLTNFQSNTRVGAATGLGIDGRSAQTKTYLPSGLTVNLGAMFVIAATSDGSSEQVVAEFGPDSSFADGTRGIRFNGGRIGAYTRNLYEIAAPTASPVNTPIAIGTNFSSAFMSLYLNGQMVNSGNTVNSTAGAAMFNIGGILGQSGQYFLRGPVTVGYVWGRTLSDGEMQSLSDNPWQIFKAPKHRLNVAAAISAAASASAAIAWTEANDAQTVAGTVTDQGAISYAESGDAWVANAVEADRATIGWTEGNDTAQLTGSVLPNASSGTSGAITWTEAGDSMSATGKLLNRGGAAWTEQDEAAALVGHANTPPIVTAAVRFIPIPRNWGMKTVHFSN